MQGTGQQLGQCHPDHDARRQHNGAVQKARREEPTQEQPRQNRPERLGQAGDERGQHTRGAAARCVSKRHGHSKSFRDIVQGDGRGGAQTERRIRRACEKSGERVAILVDEYDKPMLQAIGDVELQKAFRTTLKPFYGVLKSMDGYIKFALLTGVTKFGKVSVFSDLNNLIDLSMDRQFQTLCGMTDKEIHTYFEEPLHQIAENYGITYDEVCLRLKERYDGYRFRQNGTNLYNPFSLLNTFRSLEFGSYWFETGTPTYLVKLLKDNNFCLPDLTSEGVTAETLTDVESFKDNPIAVIYQSGYLTIKEYDEEFNIYRLGFPNKEVAEGFIKYLVPYYMPIKDSESVY